MTDGPIFHIARPADVDVLTSTGRLEPESLAAEGFVHCSTAEQVVSTTERYFPVDAELVLIELDTEAVAGVLQWPEVYPGQQFPHLHGPIVADNVVAVHSWGHDDRAQWAVDDDPR